MKECIFCKIIAGKAPAHIIYENKNILAFAPLRQDILARGHMLIIPKNHYKDIYDIPQKELSHITKGVKLISKKLKKKCQATGINILHASGKSAQQSCFHFHLHLIPRCKNDDLNIWPKTNYTETKFPEVYQKLKTVF